MGIFYSKDREYCKIDTDIIDENAQYEWVIVLLSDRLVGKNEGVENFLFKALALAKKEFYVVGSFSLWKCNKTIFELKTVLDNYAINRLEALYETCGKDFKEDDIIPLIPKLTGVRSMFSYVIGAEVINYCYEPDTLSLGSPSLDDRIDPITVLYRNGISIQAYDKLKDNSKIYCKRALEIFWLLKVVDDEDFSVYTRPDYTYCAVLLLEAFKRMFVYQFGDAIRQRFNIYLMGVDEPSFADIFRIMRDHSEMLNTVFAQYDGSIKTNGDWMYFMNLSTRLLGEIYNGVYNGKFTCDVILYMLRYLFGEPRKPGLDGTGIFNSMVKH